MLLTAFPRQILVDVLAEHLPAEHADRLFLTALESAGLPDKPDYEPEEAQALGTALLDVAMDFNDDAIDAALDAIESALDRWEATGEDDEADDEAAPSA